MEYVLAPASNMIEAASALAYLGSAVFDTALAVAGHEGYRSLHLRVQNSLLRNHDVSKTVRQSFLAGIQLVENEYRKRDDSEGVRMYFDELRANALAFFDQPATDSTDDVVIPPWSESRDRLADLALSLGGEASGRVKNFIAYRFPESFRYAFLEIGIKRNEAVRAAIHHEMLLGLERALGESNEKISDLEVSLEKVVTGIGEVLTSSEDMTAVAAKVDEVLAYQELISNSLNGPVPWGIIVIRQEGRTISRCRVGREVIRIGRESGNDVFLPHANVSRTHAGIERIAGRIYIRDLHSANGTQIDGEDILDSRRLEFGQEVSIGPFTLAILEYDVDADDIDLAGTAKNT